MFRSFVASIAALAMSSVAGSTQLPAPPVEELVAQALASAPSLSALRARLRADREMVSPAGALPDPTVELMAQNVGLGRWSVGDSEMSMAGVEMRQELSFPGKLRARDGQFAATADRAAADLDAVRRQVAAEVRTAYAWLHAADRERENLDAAQQLLELLEATVAARYGAGEAEQEAVVKAQLESSRLAERLDDLDAERAALVSQLNALLDRPGADPVGHVAGLPPPPREPPGDLEAVAIERSADVAVRRSAVVVAERNLEAARLDLKPNLFSGAAFGYRGDLDPVITLRIGATIPLRRGLRQDAMVRAATHELEMARAELRDAEARTRASAARLAAEWRRAERQVVRFREAIVPQSSVAVDAARASYLAGRGDFSTVVEDFRIWLDARTAMARREAERFTTWAEIERLVGGDIDTEGDTQ